MPDNQRKPNVLAFALIGIVALALVAVVIGLAAGGDDDDDGSAAPVDTAEEVAPVVTGETFEGDAITIPGDGPAVIVFLAHWCPHCQREVPVIVDWLAENGAPDGVELLGVATAIDEGRENFPPDEWLEREGWTVPTMVDDADSSTATKYGLTAFPYFVAVDGDGTIVDRRSGELTMAQLEAMIAAARGSG
jgi:cytochrome c biogenesis protein CcmG/thiol:disulfide interchange protein DsbE